MLKLYVCYNKNNTYLKIILTAGDDKM